MCPLMGRSTTSEPPPTEPLLLAAATAVALACINNDCALATMVEATPPTSLNPTGRLRGYRASAHLLGRAAGLHSVRQSRTQHHHESGARPHPSRGRVPRGLPDGGTPTTARRTWGAAHVWAQECSDDRIYAPVGGPGGPSESGLGSYRRWAVLASAGQGACHPEFSRRQSDIDVRQV